MKNQHLQNLQATYVAQIFLKKEQPIQKWAEDLKMRHLFKGRAFGL